MNRQPREVVLYQLLTKELCVIIKKVSGTGNR